MRPDRTVVVGHRIVTSLAAADGANRSEEHTSELQSQSNLVCRLLLEKKQAAVYVRKDRPHVLVAAARRLLDKYQPLQVSCLYDRHTLRHPLPFRHSSHILTCLELHA